MTPHEGSAGDPNPAGTADRHRAVRSRPTTEGRPAQHGALRFSTLEADVDRTDLQAAMHAAGIG